MLSNLTICPCGSQKQYTDCYRIYHQGTPAPTAGLLMPSRYSVKQRAKLTRLGVKTASKSYHPEICKASQFLVVGAVGVLAMDIIDEIREF